MKLLGYFETTEYARPMTQFTTHETDKFKSNNPVKTYTMLHVSDATLPVLIRHQNRNITQRCAVHGVYSTLAQQAGMPP